MIVTGTKLTLFLNGNGIDISKMRLDEAIVSFFLDLYFCFVYLFLILPRGPGRKQERRRRKIMSKVVPFSGGRALRYKHYCAVPFVARVIFSAKSFQNHKNGIELALKRFPTKRLQFQIYDRYF